VEANLAVGKQWRIAAGDVYTPQLLRSPLVEADRFAGDGAGGA